MNTDWPVDPKPGVTEAMQAEFDARMSEPAPTAETRVEWAKVCSCDTGAHEWIQRDRDRVASELRSRRASVNGGPARTPGEIRARQGELFGAVMGALRESLTHAEDTGMATANFLRQAAERCAIEYAENDVALADLLGDG